MTKHGAAPPAPTGSPVSSISYSTCTGSASLFRWITLDEEGPILATASVCRTVVTNEIVGFVISIDKDESWSTDGSPDDEFDVENAMAHEFMWQVLTISTRQRTGV